MLVHITGIKAFAGSDELMACCERLEKMCVKNLLVRIALVER